MADRLLLHTCCGPCSLYPLENLIDECAVTVYFENPNIHPRWEWARRRDTAHKHCAGIGVEFITTDYMPNQWSNAVMTGGEDPVPERCHRCYALRLGSTAERAARDGFDAFTTTLLVSPHQDHEAVVEAGRQAAEVHGVRFLDEDFRDGYRWGVERSRELEMYRQNYCGCILSLVERGQTRRLTKGVQTKV